MLQILSSPFRNVLAGILFMLAVSVAATLAYIGHGWSVGDAIYMVVLTVYTVGFDEVGRSTRRRCGPSRSRSS